MSILTSKWKKATVFARAFLIFALVFLLLGLGTLGNVQTTGNSYELKKGSSVVFTLSKTSTQTNLVGLYINVGTVYNEIGETATIRVRRSTSSASGHWFSSGFGDAKIDNVYSDTDKSAKGASFNWIEPYSFVSETNKGYALSSYTRYELTAQTCNVMINEIVFVADDGTVVPAAISKDFSTNVDTVKAAAMIDAQYVPSTAQSSFFRYGSEEAYSMMTIAEMRAGSIYNEGNLYHMDRINNAFGLDLLALGTLIFGMSPFGLRIFPFLASFGTLVVGYFLFKRMFRSDKAGFIFALLYTLSGATLALGHLGTPVTIGIFFFILSVYFVYSFYSKGMKEASVKSALPLVWSGLSAAASICVNGAFAIPVLGTIGLFVAGMFRQKTAKKYYLEKAETEEDKASVAAEYGYKNRCAISLFAVSFVVGLLLISLMAILPIYFTYIKVLDNPAQPIVPLVSLIWQGFVGGFIGVNATGVAQTGWTYLYQLFAGSGESYAMTLASVNAVAALAAVAGVIFAIVKLIITLASKQKGKEARATVRSAVIPLAGVVLCLIAAIFAKAGVAFIMLAYIFAFALAGKASKALADGSVAWKATFLSVVILLALCFLVAVPFVFSIPVPATWFGA